MKKEKLERLYHNKKLSMQKVADECGVTKSKVRYWMDKHNIKTRDRAEATMIIGGGPDMRVDHHGYETFQTQVKGEYKILQHHRLLAVAEHGIDAVVDKDVHHKNGIPWDNRVSNLEMLSRSEHSKRHKQATPIYDKLAMWAMHETGEYTYNEIGEIMNENPSNVGTFITNIRNDNSKAAEVVE